MAMNNSVSLDGRIVQEPKMFKNDDGSYKLSGAIAVQRTYANAKGEYEVDYINFEKYLRSTLTPAQLNRYDNLNEGDLVRITGALRTNNYVNATGQTIYSTIIEMDDFYPKESKIAKAERQARKVAATA